MERDCPALPLVIDLDLQSQDVAKLAFECIEIGVDDLGPFASSSPAGCRSGGRTTLVAADTFLNLSYRQALGDDLANQRVGIDCAGNGPGVTHTDIALHQRLPDELWKIQ